MKCRLCCLALVLLFAGSGCSFLLMTQPNEYPAPPNCRTDSWPMVVDGLFGASNMGQFVYGMTMDDSDLQTEVMLSGLTGMLVWYGSLFYGYSKKGECETALQHYYEEQEEEQYHRFTYSQDASARSSGDDGDSNAQTDQSEANDTGQIAEDHQECMTGTRCVSSNDCLSGEVCNMNERECVTLDCLRSVLVEEARTAGDHAAATAAMNLMHYAAASDSDDAEGDSPSIAPGSSRHDEDWTNQEVFTVAEAASVLQVAETQIIRWIEDDTLQAIEVDDGYRISRSALQETWSQLGGGDLFEE